MITAKQLTARRKQMHPSGLDMLSKCGEQFRRRYIEGEIIPPGTALICGTATHKSVKANLGHKLTTGELLALDSVSDAARDAVNDTWDREGVRLLEDEQNVGLDKLRGLAVDKAIRLSRLHATHLAPTIQPRRIEYPWVLKLPEDRYDFDFAGTMDLEDDAGVIHDTKTKKASPKAGEADRDAQLTSYALFKAVQEHEQIVPVGFDFLIDTKTPKVAIQRSIRVRSDFDVLLHRLEAANNCIKAGVFVPARESDWWCSKAWCGYSQTCPFFTRRVTTGPTGESE